MVASSSRPIRKKRRCHSTTMEEQSSSSDCTMNECRTKLVVQNSNPSVAAVSAHMLKCADDNRVPTLLDSAAKVTAQFVTFQRLEEKCNGRMPEFVQKRVLFWSFPRDERPLRLYSSPSTSDVDATESKKCTTSSKAEDLRDTSSYGEGLRLLDNNCVEESVQIGFHLSGLVRSTITIDGERRAFRVSMSFDRCKITAVKCNCDHRDVYWCQHVIALALYRIHYPDRVKLCLPISESLNQMDRQQLQKFAQYLISRHYTDVLPTAQNLADEVLRNGSEINSIHGAPDPTAGPADDDTEEHRWFLDDGRMRSAVRFCLNHISSSTDQFRQIFAKIQAMLKQRDSNGPRLLRLVTEQFLEHSWPGTVVAGGPPYLSLAVLEKCQNLWDQLGALWVCVVLNPYASAEQRSEWLELLRKWISSPSCPPENAFCLPSDMFCNAHVNRGVHPGLDPTKPRTVFHRALDAYCGARMLRGSVRNLDGIQQQSLLDFGAHSFPWACALVHSLRSHGHQREAIDLSTSIVRSMKASLADNIQERWLGHFLDPANIIFNCLMDAPLECEEPLDDHVTSTCRELAIVVALLALSQPRNTSTTCVYFLHRMTKQEEGLLEKLKRVKLDEQLLLTIRNGVESIFLPHQSSSIETTSTGQPNTTAVPTHTLASYLFQVFLPRDPDLAYCVGLQALELQTPSQSSQQDDLDLIIARPWRTMEACGKNSAESCQCSLALNLLTAAKDDLQRLRNVLKAIRTNVRSAVWVYRLAQDVQREAQVQPDGSTAKVNLLSSSFELGVRALRMLNNTNTNWFRKDMIRWSVSCASLLGFDAMSSLIDNWSQLFSPLEAASTVGPMVWRESMALQFKVDGHKLESMAKSVHRMAWECVSKCPSSCALPSLTLCENDPVSFESTYYIVLEAGRSGRMTAEELFSVGRYMERLSLPEKAYQTALLALGNAWIGYSDEATPLVGDVYWTCALAHNLGVLQMSAVISLIVDRVHCAAVLADVLRRCAFPPGAFTHHGLTASPSPPSIMAIVSAHPDLRRLLSAAMKAYADTVRSRLCHISPRHYGEFLEFLTKAREIFSLHEDGYVLFQVMLDQVKAGYKGKKKLVALIEQKFVV